MESYYILFRNRSTFEDHFGENLVEVISDIHANWKLSLDDLLVTTTDNGSNFVAGFYTKGWTRLSCFGHNLDLAVGKGLDHAQIQKALGCCHSLVECFSRSWKKSHDLQEKQTQLGLKNHKLIGAISTTSQANGVTNQLELEPPKKKRRCLGAVLANFPKSNESTKELLKEDKEKRNYNSTWINHE